MNGWWQDSPIKKVMAQNRNEPLTTKRPSVNHIYHDFDIFLYDSSEGGRAFFFDLFEQTRTVRHPVSSLFNKTLSLYVLEDQAES